MPAAMPVSALSASHRLSAIPDTERIKSGLSVWGFRLRQVKRLRDTGGGGLLSQSAMTGPSAVDLRGLFDALSDAVCVFDAESRCCYANPAALQLMPDISAVDHGRLFASLLPDAAALWPIDSALEHEGCLVLPQGERQRVMVFLSPLEHGCLLAIFHGDSVLHRLNRALRLQRACSKALVGARSEVQLLAQICDLVVSMGGYRMAWVGLAVDDAEKSVKCIAQAGAGESYIENLQLTWGDGPGGQGPTGSAIRLGQTQVNQNILTNPRMVPWREAALAHGYQASIALPLLAQTARYGALTIYAAEPKAFTPQEVELLEELAQDLGYGMQAWQSRAEHDQTRAEHLVLAERFNYLSKFANDMMLLVGDGGEILEANDRALEAYGYSHEDLLGMNVCDLCVAQSPEAFADDWALLRQQAHRRVETLHRRKDGSVFPVEKSERMIEVDGRAYVQSILRDISERKQAESRIQFLAHHDVLTGLPNRILAQDRFANAVAYADRAHSRVALLFLDLDNFKTVNDSLGHARGDSLLQAVALRLSDSVRETDTICRQGGDEFLILLTDLTDSDSVAFIAAKLLEHVCEPYLLDTVEVSTSASCGVAIYPDDGPDFDTLLKKADTAMYQAKAAGRNACRFFDPQMNIDADERLELRSGLRHALEHGEFILHYQPQIDLPARRLIGVETLIRWNHPQLGLLPPARFVPVAEDSGQIVQIGEWVLRHACLQMARWRQQGLPELVVAVNISAVQFRRGNLEQLVASALSDAGVSPHLLELELTESVLIKDTESVLQTVRQLKAMGVRLSIDDFGTGYSSLAYLKRFAVDKVKIDQSFIQDLANNQGSAAIVLAIIQMAQSLGLKTIAEGVEVPWLLDYLASHHCDEAQGYLIGVPMTAEAFSRYRLNLSPSASPG